MKRTELRRTPMKRARPKAKPAAIRAYWDRVASLGCCVTGRTTGVTIHHVHGGSMRGILPRGRGVKDDWFVIPLHASFHTGQYGIDGSMGVDTWEERYGTQLHYLLDVMAKTGVDPFEMSGMEWPTTVDKPI